MTRNPGIPGRFSLQAFCVLPNFPNGERLGNQRDLRRALAFRCALVVDFADEPGVSRIVWLFSLVLGHSLPVRGQDAIAIGRIGEHVAVRLLAIYQAIGSQLAQGERP